eukprot:CAMPEP_0172445226 /NCGR_PEP_ID=MMETSP1065-20121228/5118_1 /TAXON_ID=265537 /ORGANISM="Amphiprora paludosa, Strain CCMP125" /LENGTH=274 /DNA_ID=CAMNT_0013196025 /DNA_START=151 /DNA_END=975 /DNA_ORIENTATION=-
MTHNATKKRSFLRFRSRSNAKKEPVEPTKAKAPIVLEPTLTEERKQAIFQQSLHYLGQKYIKSSTLENVKGEALMPEEEDSITSGTTASTSLVSSQDPSQLISLADQHEEEESDEESDDDENSEDGDTVYTSRYWVRALTSCTSPNCGPMTTSNSSERPTRPGWLTTEALLAETLQVKENSILLEAPPKEGVVCVAADANDNNDPEDDDDDDEGTAVVPTEILSSAKSTMPDKSRYEYQVRDDDSTISTRLSVYLQGGFHQPLQSQHLLPRDLD